MKREERRENRKYLRVSSSLFIPRADLKSETEGSSSMFSSSKFERIPLQVKTHHNYYLSTSKWDSDQRVQRDEEIITWGVCVFFFYFFWWIDGEGMWWGDELWRPSEWLDSLQKRVLRLLPWRVEIRPHTYIDSLITLIHILIHYTLYIQILYNTYKYTYICI